MVWHLKSLVKAGLLLVREEQKRAEISVSASDPTKSMHCVCSTPDGGGLFGYYVAQMLGKHLSLLVAVMEGGPWEVDRPKHPWMER